MPIAQLGLELTLPPEAKVLEVTYDHVTIVPKDVTNPDAFGAIWLQYAPMPTFAGSFKSSHELAKASMQHDSPRVVTLKDDVAADGSYALEYEFDRGARHFRAYRYSYPPVANVWIRSSITTSTDDRGFIGAVLSGIAPKPLGTSTKN